MSKKKGAKLPARKRPDEDRLARFVWDEGDIFITKRSEDKAEMHLPGADAPSAVLRKVEIEDEEAE